MRHALLLLATVLLFAPVAAAQPGGVAFTDDPSARPANGGYVITFAVNEPTDVEVAVLGKDGQVVRHLAAGALGGENAPPAPLVKGLAQKLTWDGKDDFGKPAGPDPSGFKVRVRAGMRGQFGRLIGDSPYNFNATLCRGLAVDPTNGDVYVLAKKTRDASLYFLRVYDRTGKYLRELMPYRGDIDAATRRALGSVPVPWSDVDAPMNYCSLWPLFYPIRPGEDSRSVLEFKLLGVHPKDGTVLLVAEAFDQLYRIRKSDGGVVGEIFSIPIWEKGTRLAGSAGVGPVSGAISPDGKRIYFAGYAGRAPKGKARHEAWPDNRVYVRPADGTARTFAEVELAEGTKPPQTSWSVPGNVQALHGVAVDKAGHVFVCDAAAGKVRVLSADGKPVGSVDVPHAYMAAVDDRTGALYVLTRYNKAYGVWPKSLVKLSGWGPGAKVVDTLEFPERGGSLDPFLAVDFTGPLPQLWVGGAPREESVARIVEADGKLVLAEDLADREKSAPGFAIRMDVDPEADLVYLHDGWGLIQRYNGLTGEYAGQRDKDGRPAPIVGSEFCIRRDGMIYLSGNNYAGGGYSGKWHRLNRDLTEAPLDDGQKEFSDRYGKMGGGYFGNQGAAVTPDGRLYFNGMFTFRINAIFEVKADGTPGRCPRLRDLFVDAAKAEQISPHITRGGFDGALVGWLQDQSGGVEVDLQGNVYAGIRILPRDYKLPEGMADAAGRQRNYANALGCVVKFGPDGGGMVPDNLKPGQAYRLSKHWPVDVHIPEKLADGIDFAPGQRLDWYNAPWTIRMEGALAAYPILAPFSNSCACQTPRFDVDDFGRLYIPNALGCSVAVVDNAGNLVARFGRYGNFDDQAAARPGQGDIPLAYPVAAKASFRHIYVADSANRQVVRVDPAWSLEATCNVK